MTETEDQKTEPETKSSEPRDWKVDGEAPFHLLLVMAREGASDDVPGRWDIYSCECNVPELLLGIEMAAHVYESMGGEVHRHLRPHASVGRTAEGITVISAMSDVASGPVN